eukprot:TRINITY_DN19926_c0_g1_i1.p1 TRINITY_DN19926_c0_g1~~TRINITY_DN19926_c0_g1_i1.p1  ORF type:complete len:163 (+),score=30.21 TRINITY_DN19926_c0_g1_i1:40-528(+)
MGLIHLASSFVGFVLPGITTYRMLDGRHTQESSDQLLQYWVVLALFLTIESVAFYFLFWFPLYAHFKLGFILWLQSPFTQGAPAIYSKYLDPLFQKKQKDIDAFIQNASTDGVSAIRQLCGTLFEKISTIVVMVMAIVNPSSAPSSQSAAAPIKSESKTSSD